MYGLEGFRPKGIFPALSIQGVNLQRVMSGKRFGLPFFTSYLPSGVAGYRVRDHFLQFFDRQLHICNR